MSFTYRGLEAQYQRHIVTAEEVEQQLRQMQQQAPRYTAVEDRATQLGDEVVLDYAGFCDGEQFAGGTAENQALVLGSGTFIPGFEEQLVDKAVGEKVIVKVTFPAQYHSEALAGKAPLPPFVCTVLPFHSTYNVVPFEVLLYTMSKLLLASVMSEMVNLKLPQVVVGATPSASAKWASLSGNEKRSSVLPWKT